MNRLVLSKCPSLSQFSFSYSTFRPSSYDIDGSLKDEVLHLVRRWINAETVTDMMVDKDEYFDNDDNEMTIESDNN